MRVIHACKLPKLGWCVRLELELERDNVPPWGLCWVLGDVLSVHGRPIGQGMADKDDLNAWQEFKPGVLADLLEEAALDVADYEKLAESTARSEP